MKIQKTIKGMPVRIWPEVTRVGRKAVYQACFVQTSGRGGEPTTHVQYIRADRLREVKA